MSHKTFLIIGLLAITNMLTVLALNVTQREYTTLQSQASEKRLNLTRPSSDGSEDTATINENDFNAEADDTSTDMTADEMKAMPQQSTDTTVDDASLNAVSGDDFSSGLDQ